MKRTMMLSIVALAGWIVSPATAQTSDPSIAVEGGNIRGVATDVADVTVYKAVPFAAPPVGENRWKAPQPVVPWSGVKDSSAWPNRCYQLASANPPDTFYFNEYYWDPSKDPKDSEDCLYLNIWVPAKPASGSLPVMVYYHGGGNRHGNISEVEFNAAKLAAKGVIVVDAAYRLNIMGFLALPGMKEEGAGNFAILDAVEALKWVHKNIATFGGDPGKVTIAGQSAGSRNVRSVMSTPLAKGLFQRAIMHSSPTVMAQRGKPNYVTLADKTAAAGPVFEKAFPGKSLDDLKKLPVEEFYKDPAKIDAMYAVTWLNERYGEGSPLYQDLARLIKLGVDEGWAANQEVDGPNYRRSRILEPMPETFQFSITAVYMNSTDPRRFKDEDDHDVLRGQYHGHPYGELNLVVPLNKGAELKGLQGWQGPGWTAPDPGSRHYPEVRGGAVIALFYLPAGRISYDFTAPI